MIHQADERRVGQDDADADGNQQQGFPLLTDAQKDEQQSNGVHQQRLACLVGNADDAK